jgi:hypothetical protein
VGIKIVKEQNEMISFFCCITSGLKGSWEKRLLLFELFPEGRPEHLPYIGEGFKLSPVVPGVVGYVDALGFFFGFAFQKPGEELLDSFFSHIAPPF